MRHFSACGVQGNSNSVRYFGARALAFFGDPHHLGASSADDHASIHHRQQDQTSIFVPIKAATDQFAANILPIGPSMRVEAELRKERH